VCPPTGVGGIREIATLPVKPCGGLSAATRVWVSLPVPFAPSVATTLTVWRPAAGHVNVIGEPTPDTAPLHEKLTGDTADGADADSDTDPPAVHAETPPIATAKSLSAIATAKAFDVNVPAIPPPVADALIPSDSPASRTASFTAVTVSAADDWPTGTVTTSPAGDTT